MQAEANLFSGRPNPSWELDPVAARELRALIARLPPEPRVPEYQGLGYRGVSVTDDPGGLKIVARNGTVWRYDGPACRCLSDPARTVERALLAHARARLDPAEFQILEQDMALD
jgi:hypothetical protein